MKKKNLSKLVALAVLLGGVSYGSSAWAGETGYTITVDDYDPTTIEPRLNTLFLGGRNERIGIVAGSCIAPIEKIATSKRYVWGTDVYGICYIGNYRRDFLRLRRVDEIEVGTRRGTAHGILLGCLDETSTTTTIGRSADEGLGSIKAEAAKESGFFEESNRDAYGLYS